MNPLRGFAHLLGGVLVVIVAWGTIRAGDSLVLITDLSSSASNTLAPQSLALLERLPGPIEAFALVPRGAAVTPALEAFFDRYARAHEAFSFTLIDPADEVERARELGAGLGEIVLRHGGRSERLTELDEATVANALARLARGEDRYVTVLNAHGERRLARRANHDLSMLTDTLETRGLALREFALDRQVAIPGNTALLVIASPRVPYSLGELERVLEFIDSGGNLLWLTEPDRPPGLGQLAKALGIEQLSGTIIDPRGLTLLENGNPAFTVSADYGRHAALDGFDQPVVMPYAAALATLSNSTWQSTVLTSSGDEAWTELDDLDGPVAFDGDAEIRGTLAIAIALTRSLDNGREQRVVVVGDGDFASNTFVQSLGNREFARRLIEWLAIDDQLVALQIDPVADAVLDLEMWQRLTLFVVFALLLPAGFLANGLWLWWGRRRA